MEHTDNAYESLQHYFNVLESVGKYKKQDMVGLFIYCFIVDQIFDGPLQPYLDDKGLAALNKAILCIAKNGCLVAMPSTGIHISQPRDYYIGDLYRFSEYGALRYSEDGKLRSAESGTKLRN